MVDDQRQQRSGAVAEGERSTSESSAAGASDDISGSGGTIPHDPANRFASSNAAPQSAADRTTTVVFSKLVVAGVALAILVSYFILIGFCPLYVPLHISTIKKK